MNGDAAQARLIEELSFNAWPALRTLACDGWLVCLANGYTRRANSVHPLYAPQGDALANLAACQQTYASWGQPCIVKLSPASQPNNLDALLEAAGYARQARTSVQVRPLAGRPAEIAPQAELALALDDAWLTDFARLSRTAPAHLETLRQMLARITPARCFLALRRNGRAVACGLAVSQAGYVGLFDIVTDEAYRGQGLGAAVVDSLLAWGKSTGAHTAYLQVMLDNQPALRLYARLGFAECYPYWYRVERRS